MVVRSKRSATILRGRSDANRVDEIRTAIAEGTYAPDVADVSESLLAWIAPPEIFEFGIMLVPGNAERNTSQPNPRR